ncbi:MAG: FtsQ-type POTRA domain-containing protein [Deltaproteobacteria bacterium]|nr:FtsQ-type POTRA domain-containing protein [Deltaproteobacteria bacterium]
MNFKPGKQRRNRRLKEPFFRRARRFALKRFKMAVVIASLPALCYGGWRLYRELITTPYLDIQTINVAGVQRVTEEEVVELSGLSEGQNLLAFRGKDVIAGIKKNPWVEKAEVRRSLPDTVDIEITERQPLVLVKLDDLYVMDREGVVFKKASHEDDLDLPVVTGLTREGLKKDSKGLTEGLLELIRALKDRKGFNLARVSEIHVDPTFGLSVYTLDEGVRLELGVGGYEQKFASFEKILRSREGTLRGIEAMDLNNCREVVVRFNSNVAKEGGDTHGQKG